MKPRRNSRARPEGAANHGLPAAAEAARADAPLCLVDLDNDATRLIERMIRSLYDPSEIRTLTDAGKARSDASANSRPHREPSVYVYSAENVMTLDRPEGLRYAVAVTEPVAHAMSLYKSFLATTGHPLHQLASQAGSLGAFLRDRRGREALSDTQCRRLGAVVGAAEKRLIGDASNVAAGARLDLRDVKTVRSRTLSVAAHRLNQMSFVATSDLLRDGLALLCEIMGWPFLEDLPAPEDQPSPTDSGAIAPEDAIALRRINRGDQHLYELAQLRFGRDWARSRHVSPTLHAFVSYAQNAEDVVLSRAFGSIENGTYVDVGANDPAGDSVTKAFYVQGWRGVNVEPVASSYEALCRERPHDINVRAAITSSRGTRPFFKITGTGLSTLVPTIAERHRSEGFEVVNTEVPVMPLQDIIDEAKLETIHFLKVDVEGCEREVLESIDFRVTKPWVIVVEATVPNSTIASHDAWESLVIDAGYELALFDGLNRFYLLSSRVDLRERLACAANCTDHFIRATEYESRRTLRRSIWQQRRQEVLLRDYSERLKATEAWATSADAHARALVTERDGLRAELERAASARASDAESAARQVKALSDWATSADQYGKSLLSEYGQLRNALEVATARRDEANLALATISAELHTQKLYADSTVADLRAELTASGAENDMLRRRLLDASATTDETRALHQSLIDRCDEHATRLQRDVVELSTKVASAVEPITAAARAIEVATDLATSRLATSEGDLRAAAARNLELEQAHNSIQNELATARLALDKTSQIQSERLASLGESLNGALDRAATLEEERASLAVRLDETREQWAISEAKSDEWVRSLRASCASMELQLETSHAEVRLLRVERDECRQQLNDEITRLNRLLALGESLVRELRDGLERKDVELSEQSTRISELNARYALDVERLSSWARSADSYARALQEERDGYARKLDLEREAAAAERLGFIEQIRRLGEWASSADVYGRSLVIECERLRAAHDSHSVALERATEEAKRLSEELACSVARADHARSEREGLVNTLEALQRDTLRDHAEWDASRKALEIEREKLLANVSCLQGEVTQVREELRSALEGRIAAARYWTLEKKRLEERVQALDQRLSGRIRG